MLLPLLAAALVAAQDPAPAPGPPGFRDLSLPAALLAAASEKRPVLIAFGAPDSDECKAMEELTWKDPVVLRWLEARVVAIRVDVGREAELAERYHIDRVPVTLLLTTEGDEGERFSGLVQGRDLMAQAQAVVFVLPDLAALRKRVNAEPANPQPRLELAQAYISYRMPERATEHLLWGWDHGGAAPEFQATRRGVLAYQLGQLSRSQKALRKELVARRDALRARLLRFSDGDDPLALTLDTSALNTALNAPDKQLELWNALKAVPDVKPELIRAAFTEGLALLLFRDRRFEELLAGRGDVLAHFDGRYVELARDQLAAEAERVPVAPDAPPAPGIDPIEVRRNGLLSQAGMYMEALAATGRIADARSLWQLVLLFDARPQVYIALTAAAGRGRSRALVAEFGELGRKALRDPADLAKLESVLALHLGGTK